MSMQNGQMSFSFLFFSVEVRGGPLFLSWAVGHSWEISRLLALQAVAETNTSVGQHNQCNVSGTRKQAAAQ